MAKKSSVIFTFHVWKEEDGKTTHSLDVSLQATDIGEAKERLSKFVDLAVYQNILKEISES